MANGILSLLQMGMNKNSKGGASDKEMSYFMDKDTGTEFDPLKKPTRVAGAVSDTELANMKTDAYGNSIIPKKLNIQELQSKFASILGGLSEPEQVPIIQHWQQSDDDGKIGFMQMIVDDPSIATGYGMQDEVLLQNQRGAMSNREVNNLGFGY